MRPRQQVAEAIREFLPHLSRNLEYPLADKVLERLALAERSPVVEAAVRADQIEKDAALAEATLPIRSADQTRGYTAKQYGGVAIAAAIRAQLTEGKTDE